MASAFDADTAVTPRLPHGAAAVGRPAEYDVGISDRWNVGSRPNGGYLLALAGRAIGATLPHPDPFSLTGHFLSPPDPGPAVVEVTPVRVGRSLATATARVTQDDADGRTRERLRVLATYGELAGLAGHTAVTAVPPVLPAPEDCVRAAPSFPGGTRVAIVEQFDIRLDPPSAGWAAGRPSGEAVMRGWLRFADGHDADPLSLLLIGDVFPPTAFNLGLTGWVPTIEMTVHVRGIPVPGWLRMVVTTRNVSGGYLEEDAEIWDEADQLVAQSRQLARLTSTTDGGSSR
ncbi:MAG: thioesterase family protein [Mycobacteriales bacterium]